MTVGAFHAGTRPNVIAGKATFCGTARAHDHGVREALLAGIERQVRAIAVAQGVEVDVEIKRCSPPLRNPSDGAALAREAALAAGANPVPFDTTNMGGEDFAHYLLHVPGCYVRIGGAPEGDSYPAHSSRFDFDEAAMPWGAAWLAEVARRGSSLMGRDAD